MYPKFEEKTFENYFNNELDIKSKIYFPFGQIQEGSIGCDSAAYSNNRQLWKKVGAKFLLRPNFMGADLREIAHDLENFLKHEIRNIPNIKVNLLFQYKRSQFIRSKRSDEWKRWNQKYFRYEIYKKQHSLLEKIESRFGKNVLVLYAAPAIENINELIKIKMESAIIDNTNFRKASELTGHKRNTFIKAGTFSIACSEPVHLKNFDLIEMIHHHNNLETEDNYEQILSLSENIKSSINDHELSKPFSARLSEFQDHGLQEFKLLYSMLTMMVFKEITGVQWAAALT